MAFSHKELQCRDMSKWRCPINMGVVTIRPSISRKQENFHGRHSSRTQSQGTGHPIGKLQEIRTKLKGLAHQPGHDIFRPNTKTITDYWAFHYGGRSELQFNIGLENNRGTDELWYGVAFSFKTNQTLPSIDILIPQVAVFNDYMRLHPELYQDMPHVAFPGQYPER